MDTMLDIGKDTVPGEKDILTLIWEPTSQPPFIDDASNGRWWHDDCLSSL